MLSLLSGLFLRTFNPMTDRKVTQIAPLGERHAAERRPNFEEVYGERGVQQ